MFSNRRFLVLLALTLMILSPANSRAVEIIGHRGASHDAPENTVASVILAWEQGADAAEIDIYLTRDNRIVAIHDETTERTTGEDWKVADRTLAELATLDAGSWKTQRFAGEPIPTLEAILDTVPEGKRLFIEIKCGPEVLPHLQTVLKNCPKSPAQIVLIAFDLPTITEAKRRMPDIPAYLLFGTTPKVDKETGRISDRPEELIARCVAAKLDGLDLKFDGQITPDFIERLESAGKKLYVWTVNDARVARQMAELGVAGITTDRPEWLRQQLEAAVE